MECLVRIAEQKYIISKVTESYAEAIALFWEEHLKEEFVLYDPHIWRVTRYWNEECDYCLKNYRRLLDWIYNHNSSKKVKPGQAPFMCLEELN